MTALRRTFPALTAAALFVLFVPEAKLAAQQVRADVVGLEVVEIAHDRVMADIRVEVESERRVRVRSFRFQRITANGMPAYVDPVFEPVEIAPGERLALPAFRATIRFREANGLQPLRALLEQAEVRIAGTARVEIELGWLGRIVTGSARGVVWRAFDERLDVALPGGRVRELSTRALFAVAEPVAQAGLALRRKTGEWLDGELADSLQRVAAVRSVYAYDDGDSAPVRVEAFASGVVLSPQTVLVPLEAIEPWRFDPAMASAMKRDGVKIAPQEEIEVVVPSPDGAAPERYKLSLGEVAVRTGPCESERVLLTDEAGRTRSVKVCSSGAASNLATLEILPARSDVAPLAAHASLASGPHELTTLRLIAGPQIERPQWELARLQGEAAGDSIRLAQPIDRAAIGSPLLVDGMPVGIVLSEGGGALLPDAAP